MLDLVLAIGHHLLIFGLAAILTAEAVLVRPGMSSDDVRRVAAVDAWYGVVAVLILAVGAARLAFAAKGWAFYAHNPWFHAKMGTFLAVGLLSIAPTIAFIKWNRARKHDGSAPDAAAIARARRFVLAEVALFALIPVFAAAMARNFSF